jgi:hypothetical protein
MVFTLLERVEKLNKVWNVKNNHATAFWNFLSLVHEILKLHDVVYRFQSFFTFLFFTLGYNLKGEDGFHLLKKSWKIEPGLEREKQPCLTIPFHHLCSRTEGTQEVSLLQPYFNLFPGKQKKS